MKRILAIGTILACVYACTVKEEIPQDEQEQGLMEISISATSGENDPDTKAVLGAGNKVFWSKGDQISLINKTGESNREKPLTLTSGQDTDEATFTGKVYDCSAGWYGVYPYNYEHKLHKKDTLSLAWTGRNQKALDGGISPAQLLMVGQTSSNNDGKYSIQFKNLFAYIKFTLDFDCSGFTVFSNSEDVLTCSSLKVVFDENGMPVITDRILNTTTDDGAVHLDAGNDVTKGTYYIAVVPQTLEEGFSINVKVNGKTYWKSTTKSVELKRNTILNIGTLKLENFTSDGNFYGGGTYENPYQISSLEDLNKLSDLVFYEDDGHYASAYYKQTQDIKCDGKKLESIGFWSSTVTNKYFKGTYDGDNHKIYDYVPSPVKSSCGLFGGVENATLKNIILEPNSYTKNFKYAQYGFYGVLVGYATGNMLHIYNCKVQGTANWRFNMDDDAVYVGSMIGYCTADLTMTNCTNSVDFTTYETSDYSTHEPIVAGGLIGHVFAGADNDIKRDIKIDRCRNTGNIWTGSSNESYAGGIVGRAYEDSNTGDVALMITNCVNEGNISAVTNKFDSKDTAAGGIVGSNRSNGYGTNLPFIYNCLNKGEIRSVGNDGYGGGIIGFIYDGDTKLYACVNTGSVHSSIEGQTLSGQDPHLGAIGGDNYSGFTNPGYYYYCYWTNTGVTGQGMPIVYGEPEYGHASNCSFKDLFQKESISSSDLNSISSKIPNTDYKYAEWTGIWSLDEKTLNIINF